MSREGEEEVVGEERGEDPLTMETLITALREFGEATPGDRYRLRPPIFGGDGEQFIREFEEVATLAEWPAPVRILHLRTCLTGPQVSFRADCLRCQGSSAHYTQR